ncbi:cytochrome P450 72A15 [Vigna radiata var. radiata]|uniref:Cytochrome P450 72A15 n=1 Tax=Vigna radiata var. radiata TaxID=3916 RepID=A0A1S3V9K4_VIGRR|nr:cytochrome P450 72A15 [Vigna radiata var. radiata]
MVTMGASAISSSLNFNPSTCAIVTFIATVLLWWFWNALNWVWLRPKRIERRLKEQGIQGNSYRPLIGDIRDMVKMIKEVKSKPMDPHSNDIAPRVLPYVVHTIAKYGKNSFMWLGPRPRLFVLDPEKIKEMATKVYDFQKPDTSPLFKLLASGFANYDGDKWAKHRKIVSPAFNVERLKVLVPIFCESCDEMVMQLETALSSSNGSSELDLWPFVQNVSSDVLARAGFGSSYQEGKRVFELQREMLQLTMTLFKFAFIPGYRFLPTHTNRRMKAIDNEIRASLMKIINRRLKAMKTGEPTNNDLLGILLESNYKESEKNTGGGMSLREVVEEVKLFYLAGQEANAELLVWTLLLLSKHPDWQAKAREEVFQVFGNEKPDYERLGQLKVVSMILQESLRLYPPVVMFARYLRKDTKLGELTIPAGVELIVPVSMIHQEKEYWGDDAGEFNPERFSEGVSKATKGKLSYLPFGWGPRLCIGQNFGLLEAKVAVSMILQRFSLEFSPSYTHAPSFIITLQPERGAHIILRKL